MSTLNQLVSSSNFPQVPGLLQQTTMKERPQSTEKELNEIVAQINTLLLSNTGEARRMADKLVRKVAGMDVPESIKQNAIAKLPESVQSQIRKEAGKSSKNGVANGAYAAEVAYMMKQQAEIDLRNNQLFTAEQMRRWSKDPEMRAWAAQMEESHADMMNFINTDFKTVEEVRAAVLKMSESKYKAMQKTQDIFEKILEFLRSLPPDTKYEDLTPEQQEKIRDIQQLFKASEQATKKEIEALIEENDRLDKAPNTPINQEKMGYIQDALKNSKDECGILEQANATVQQIIEDETPAGQSTEKLAETANDYDMLIENQKRRQKKLQQPNMPQDETLNDSRIKDADTLNNTVVMAPTTLSTLGKSSQKVDDNSNNLQPIDNSIVLC